MTLNTMDNVLLEVSRHVWEAGGGAGCVHECTRAGITYSRLLVPQSRLPCPAPCPALPCPALPCPALPCPASCPGLSLHCRSPRCPSPPPAPTPCCWWTQTLPHPTHPSTAPGCTGWCVRRVWDRVVAGLAPSQAVAASLSRVWLHSRPCLPAAPNAFSPRLMCACCTAAFPRAGDQHPSARCEPAYQPIRPPIRVPVRTLSCVPLCLLLTAIALRLHRAQGALIMCQASTAGGTQRGGGALHASRACKGEPGCR